MKNTMTPTKKYLEKKFSKVVTDEQYQHLLLQINDRNLYLSQAGRISSRLHYCGIDFLWQLAMLSEDEILALPKLGRQSKRNIFEVLKFKCGIDYAWIVGKKPHEARMAKRAELIIKGVEVASEGRERKEYDRLKRKFHSAKRIKKD